MKGKEQLRKGSTITMCRTIHEEDINKFAELTGDFSPNHMDEKFMKNSPYGKRIAHGALLVGYMSTASSMLIDKYQISERDYIPVSLGYDRIRFIKPVFIGDTITIKYIVEKYNPDLMRSASVIEITNQHEELVAVATHILKWIANISK